MTWRRRTRAFGALILSLVFFALWTTGVNARTRPILVDSVGVHGDSVFVTFQAPGLFDNTVLRALRRGATSAVEYEIRLWRDRKFVPDALISTRRWRVRIVYDHLEAKYLLFEADTSAGLPVELEEAIRRCERRRREFVFSPVRSLKPGRYFVSVSVVVEPLAVENYRELKRWVSGEAKTLAERLKKGNRAQEERGRLFQILLELTGFGDRVRGGRSLPFEIRKDQPSTSGESDGTHDRWRGLCVH